MDILISVHKEILLRDPMKRLVVDILISVHKEILLRDPMKRLVVMSATMDDDYPMYQSFFSSMKISRLHIAVPRKDHCISQNSPYKVEEIKSNPRWSPVVTQPDILIQKKQLPKIAREILEKVKTKHEGDSLIFVPTSVDVDKVAQELNSTLWSVQKLVKIGNEFG
jgi:HrpA-like RNA helicase